jgi:hypothetical protein
MPPRHHWASGPGWLRLPSLAGGLAKIAENGSGAQLLARASIGTQAWSRGWASDEVIVECATELRLGAVAGLRSR